MLGAVLGDIIGSCYERNNVKSKDFPLVTSRTRYTDDTVMTLVVAQWLMEDAAHSEAGLILRMQKLGRAHLRAGYGHRFKEWLMAKDPQPYNSWGNGSAMRVSPVGLYAESETEALQLARMTASVTHNHPEGIKGAEAVALAVYVNRQYASLPLERRKELSRDAIAKHCGYDLNRTLDEIRPNYGFDVSCQGSVPEAIIAYLESSSAKECVRNAISIGGDSDTIASIACSIFMAGEDSRKTENAWTNGFEKYLSNDLARIMSAFERLVYPSKPTYNSYKVTDWLWAGEYPGDRSEDAAKEKLRQFRRFGITHFIDLTEEGELVPYEPYLQGNSHHLRFPIRDQSVPTDIGSVKKLLEKTISIHESDANAKLYIHCWGGVGRTGTIVGCFLAHFDKLDYEDAISVLTRLFEECPKSVSRRTPENSMQMEFIRQFILVCSTRSDRNFISRCHH